MILFDFFDKIGTSTCIATKFILILFFFVKLSNSWLWKEFALMQKYLKITLNHFTETQEP